MTVCFLARNGIKIYPDGDVRRCCKSSKSFGNLKDSNFIKIWKSDDRKSFVNAIENGERLSECNSCWGVEDSSLTSHRQIFNDKFNEEQLDNLTYIEIGISNLCNLSCKMCIPQLSTGVNNVWSTKLQEITFIPKRGHIRATNNVEQLILELREVGAESLREISFSGGEPLIEKDYMKILEGFIDSSQKISVSIVSNFTNLKIDSSEWLPLLKKFRHTAFTISIDGTKEVFEYVRYGASFDTVVSNYRAAKEALPSASFYGCIAISATNVPFISDTVKMLNADFDLDAIIPSFDESKFVSIRNLPLEIKQQTIEKLSAIKTNDETEKMIISSCLNRLNDVGNPDQFLAYISELDKKHNTDISLLWKQI